MVVGELETGTDILIIGAGPAGYTAAIRCAQLGMDVTLVNNTELGGVCLHKGCIPVKTMLYVLQLAEDCREGAKLGLNVKDVSIDLKGTYAWKDKVVHRLESGVRELCIGNGVQLMDGFCTLLSPSTAVIKGTSGTQRIAFKRAVIATGCHFKGLPDMPFDGRLIVSPNDVTLFDHVPEEMVIIGSGYAGVTVASLIAAMGTKLTVIHKSEKLLSFVDDDVMRPVLNKFRERGVTIYDNATYTIEKSSDKVLVTAESSGKKHTIETKKLLLALGIVGNTDRMGIENTKIKPIKNGFIEIDMNYRTSDPSFYAIGDVTGGHTNAARAFREGAALAEILAGKPGLPDYAVMPHTISTEPEIASAGMTESQAKDAGIDILTAAFPFTANGKAVSMGKTEGFVKVVAENASHRILGFHIVGDGAFDIIDEALLAIEMGARLEDVALTIHPHPTLSESLREACAMALGTSTNIMGRPGY